MSIQQTDEAGRARIAIKECRWTDAIADLTTAYKQDPEDASIVWQLGFALSKNEQYDEAIRVLDEMHRRQPANPRWPYMIGYQHYQQGGWREAIDWFDRALALHPGYIKALYRKGYAHTQVGQEQEAIRAHSECIGSWEKSTPDAQERDQSNYGKAQFQLGKIYLRKGLSLKARRHLQIAARIHDDDHDVLYELGKCHLMNKQFEDALREFEASDRIKPGTDYVLDRLAQTHARKGDYAAAERAFQRIPAHRRRPFVLQHMGMMYLEQGQHDKALLYLEPAARKQPENHNVHYALGCAQEAVGEPRRAQTSYERAVNLRKTTYSLEFREAEEGLKRMTEAIAALPSADRVHGSETNGGVVQTYNESRGYGFINSNSRGRIFFHVSAIVGQEKPRPGSRVTFSCESSPKGLRAVRVKLTEP
jgi:tetratricopeptide (TPR) repeat protein/cold shock CspA family protein